MIQGKISSFVVSSAICSCTDFSCHLWELHWVLTANTFVKETKAIEKTERNKILSCEMAKLDIFFFACEA